MSEKSKQIIFMGNTSNHISFTDMETGRTWTFGAANTNYENIRKWIIDKLVCTPMYAGQEIEIIGGYGVCAKMH